MLTACLTRCGLAAALLILSACGPGTGSRPDTEPAKVRPSLGELQAGFEANLAAARATRGPGKPPVWTLSDTDTVIHLFGTVHLLRPGMDWGSDAFEAAFEGADTLVLEVDTKSQQAQARMLQDFVARGLYQDGRTLRGALDPADEAVIEAALDSVGLPLDSINSFEPWLAAVNLSTRKLQADGYDPAAGIETLLQARAEAAGKAFAYLEEISDQADAFDLMSEPAQIDFLYQTAVQIEDSPRMLDLMVAEWADGDIAGIAALAASPDPTGLGDEAYQAVLVRRNAAWVPQIEAMLDLPGQVFIAVGAAHLAGPDSVIAMLRQRGHAVDGP